MLKLPGSPRGAKARPPPTVVCPRAGLWETRPMLSNNDPTPSSPPFLPNQAVPFDLPPPGKSSRLRPLPVLGTPWKHLYEPGSFHFFPTPLVTFDLECRFLLLEEWLSLLPGCLVGPSSEPGQEDSGHRVSIIAGCGPRLCPSALALPNPAARCSSTDPPAPSSGLANNPTHRRTGGV